MCIGFDFIFSDTNLLRELKEIFDPADAEHVYQAVTGGCRYFVTVDRKTIIDRAVQNKDKIDNMCNGLIFIRPVDLL